MRTYDSLLGFAAGVMTAIATLGLIHESYTQGGVLIAGVGLAVGAAALFALDRFLPHKHPSLNGMDPDSYRRGLLHTHPHRI